jgi:hypothetical protein
MNKWSFLNNYRTEESASASQQAHYNTWKDLYPKMEYRIEYHVTFCDNYLLYVRFNDN